MDNEGRVFTVSGLVKRVRRLNGISLSLPRIIGKDGVAVELQPGLTEEENEALEGSANVLRTVVNGLIS
jgi:L-lactate dehydrogenase